MATVDMLFYRWPGDGEPLGFISLYMMDFIPLPLLVFSHPMPLYLYTSIPLIGSGLSRIG
jgi:hypothetical protein